jgi:hypothetical protein
MGALACLEKDHPTLRQHDPESESPIDTAY